MSIPEAFRAAYKDRVTQVALAEDLGVTQPTISDWGNRTEGKLVEWLNQIARVEELAGRPRGWVLIQAGYVAEVKSVADAIDVDPLLDDNDREMLRGAYRRLAQSHDGVGGEHATNRTDG